MVDGSGAVSVATASPPDSVTVPDVTGAKYVVDGRYVYSMEEELFAVPDRPLRAQLLKFRSNAATSTVDFPAAPCPEIVSCVYPDEFAVSVAQTGELLVFDTVNSRLLGDWMVES